jgi:hypothetical protein
VPIVYGVDYQGIYTAVTFTRRVGELLTRVNWRVTISDGLSLSPVRSDYVFTLTGVRGQRIVSTGFAIVAV